jgi:P27 family predicted phage terminase small subunit
MPTTLTEGAQREWKRMTKLLKKRGTLTTVDSAALGIYCEVFARWELLVKDITKRGAMIDEVCLDRNGEQYERHVVNPAVKLAAAHETSLRLYLQQFAATPASREAVKPPPPDPKDGPPAPGSLADLLAQRAALPVDDYDPPAPKETDEDE